MPYRNATICINGHVIHKFESNHQPYCSLCGAKTISYCPNCNAPIHGVWENPNIISLSKPYKPPYYCYSCGTPYPWTTTILEKATDLLSLDTDVDDSTKQLIKSAIPSLIIDMPDTPVAIAKYQTAVSSLAEIVRNGLHNLLIDVVSESVRKLLFP